MFNFIHFFRKKIFSADFRPNFGRKLGYMSKCRLKNRPNHVNTKWPEGWCCYEVLHAHIRGERTWTHTWYPAKTVWTCVVPSRQNRYGKCLENHIFGLFLVYWLWIGPNRGYFATWRYFREITRYDHSKLRNRKNTYKLTLEQLRIPYLDIWRRF